MLVSFLLRGSWKAQRANRMRICLVSQEYPPETPWGGIGTQTWLKANGLTARGHEVHVLTCSDFATPKLRTETHDGVVVHRLQPPGHDFAVYERQAYWVGYSWQVFRHLQELIEQQPFDVIDFPEFAAEGYCYLLDRNVYNFCPIVVHLHGSLAMFTEHMGWPERGTRLHQAGSFMERFCVQRADALCANSQATAQIASTYCGVAEQSIDIVHCGVDADQFSANSRQEDPEQPTILFVGAMVHNKGPEILLEAALKLRTKYPRLKLSMVGNDDKPLADEMKDRVRAAGAEANVTFHGFVPLNELPNYYRRASIFCSPAEFEGGTASVYLEAMACGCPPVVSTAGGGVEAVLHGETGLLVPPKDVDATAAALDRLLSDEPMRQRMGVAGRERIENYFSRDRFIDRMLQTYEKGIAHGNGLLTRMRKLEGLE